MTSPLSVEVSSPFGPVSMAWSGGRLADVSMMTMYDSSMHVVDCQQVCEYDWERGLRGPDPTVPKLRGILRAWIHDHAREFYENA